MRLPLLLSALLIAHGLCAQNLVPNGSFEEISDCPNELGQIERATGWLTFRGWSSCDLFHVCAHPDSCGVPLNMLGEQTPAHGDAYAGIHTFSDDDGFPCYYREWIGIQLSEPLVVGATYHASLKVSLTLAGTSIIERIRFANDHVGLLFSTIYFFQADLDPVPGHAQVYGSSVVVDSLGWQLISGSFVADSAYGYVVVGNFFSDEETNWSLMDANGTGYLAYYYVDDVCVSTDPQYCLLQNGVGAAEVRPYRVWQSGPGGVLNVDGLLSEAVEQIVVVDVMGRTLLERRVGSTDTWSTSTDLWAAGVYMVLAIRADGSRSVERVFVGR